MPAVLDGREWVTNDGPDYDDCVRLFGSVAADGTCFEYEDYGTGLMRQEDGSGGQPIRAADVGFGPGIHLVRKPVSENGIVWAAAFRDTGRPSEQAITFEGLARYDGQSWESIPYPKEDAPRVHGPLAVAPDGVVWMSSYADSDGLTMVSWDGEEWRSYGPLAVARTSADAHFHQDGTITFGVMATFDGTSLTRLEVPDPVVRDMGPLTFAPDASAWAVRNGGLYVITPEAVATTE